MGSGNYIITEPSPSSTTYIRSGRGGIGNTFRATPSTTSSTIPASTIPSSSGTSSRRFFSGIGGAGNVHSASERPPLSLDEEFRRAAARDRQSVGHTGIGGWGNVYRKKSDASDASSEAAAVADDASETSSMTTKSKMWARAVTAAMRRD